MNIRNTTQQSLIASRATVANTFLSRMKGLLGRTALPEGEGLVITHCQSIHMVCMKFPIDVIFLDCHGHVVGLVSNIKPFHFSPIFWKAECAIEVPVGCIQRTKTIVGDYLIFEK